MYSAAEPLQKHHESPFVKFLVSGTVTWSFELVAGHPLEFMKIAKQTSTSTYRELFLGMTRHKGVMGLLDGYFPWGSLQCFFKGASFGFGQALGMRLCHGRMSDHAAQVASGGIGGAFQGVVLSPLLLLKTRVMTDPAFRTSGGVWATTKASTKVGFDMVRNEGPLVLMKGSGIFTAKRVADWTSRFFFAEVAESAARKLKGDGEPLSLVERSTASMIGGSVSAVVTIPLDVLVATVQDAKKAGQRVRLADVFREHTRDGGVRQLLEYSTRGVMMRVLHVGLTTLLMKTAASAVYKALFPRPEEGGEANK